MDEELVLKKEVEDEIPFELKEVKEELENTEEPEEREETGDVGDQDNAEAIRELRGYLQNCGMFYVFSNLLRIERKGERNVYTGMAKCMQPGCRNKGVTYTSVSRSHLTSHYQTMHPEKKPELAAALAGNRRRGRSMDSPCRQERTKQMFTRWFVETLAPLTLCEHPYTRELFTHLSPTFQLMSRRTLVRDLDGMMDEVNLEVNKLLSKQKWVATTADTWTVDKRTFLGMTVHWIDPPTLKRKKATLACRELEVSQTHQPLGEVIHDVHREFDIVRKVVATTTDNGANYAFGAPEEEEEDEELVQGQPCHVQGHLHGGDIGAEAQITLPPHRRCSVHTLNLMATTDIGEVMGWSTGNAAWHKAIAKAQHLWHLQNQNPIAANQIREAARTKLTTPVVARWNSYLNSVKKLLEVMSLPGQVEAVNNILRYHPRGKGGAAFLDHDIKVLTEYRDVMECVVDTLESLQGEDNAYMGVLLPKLLVLKKWLLQHQQRGELQYVGPLVQSLLNSFDERLGSLLEDQDLLMACALHPSFTPAFLTRNAPDHAHAIKGRILRELKAMVRPTEGQRAPHAQPDPRSPQDVVRRELLGAAHEEEEEEEALRVSLESWRSQREALSWALFPEGHREAWVDLFIKYNTPLPYSAGVERVFSAGGDILRPRRDALASPDFHRRVFLKGNMPLLGYPSYNGQFGEEEQ